MRVLVCGDRHWKNKEAVRRELEKLPAGTVIIHGAAPGADTLAGEVARELNFPVEEYPAEWPLYGRSAGPIRNRKMLAAKPDKVLAFHADITKSKGTKHMVSIAVQGGVAVEIKES